MLYHVLSICLLFAGAPVIFHNSCQFLDVFARGGTETAPPAPLATTHEHTDAKIFYDAGMSVVEFAIQIARQALHKIATTAKGFASKFEAWRKNTNEEKKPKPEAEAKAEAEASPSKKFGSKEAKSQGGDKIKINSERYWQGGLLDEITSDFWACGFDVVAAADRIRGVILEAIWDRKWLDLVWTLLASTDYVVFAVGVVVPLFLPHFWPFVYLCFWFVVTGFQRLCGFKSRLHDYFGWSFGWTAGVGMVDQGGPGGVAKAEAEGGARTGESGTASRAEVGVEVGGSGRQHVAAVVEREANASPCSRYLDQWRNETQTETAEANDHNTSLETRGTRPIGREAGTQAEGKTVEPDLDRASKISSAVRTEPKQRIKRLGHDKLELPPRGTHHLRDVAPPTDASAVVSRVILEVEKRRREKEEMMGFSESEEDDVPADVTPNLHDVMTRDAGDARQMAELEGKMAVDSTLNLAATGSRGDRLAAQTRDGALDGGREEQKADGGEDVGKTEAKVDVMKQRIALLAVDLKETLDLVQSQEMSHASTEI